MSTRVFRTLARWATSCDWCNAPLDVGTLHLRIDGSYKPVMCSECAQTTLYEIVTAGRWRYHDDRAS